LLDISSFVVLMGRVMIGGIVVVVVPIVIVAVVVAAVVIVPVVVDVAVGGDWHTSTIGGWWMTWAWIVIHIHAYNICDVVVVVSSSPVTNVSTVDYRLPAMVMNVSH
jgi:hypothetical protein